MTKDAEYLNFGAGNPVPGWWNLDASPAFLLPEPAHRLLAALHLSSRSRNFVGCRYNACRFRAGRPLPCPLASLRAVYCSHVLEHLPAPHIAPLLDEFARRLIPGGIVRLIVPDLRATMSRLVAAPDAVVAFDDSLGTVPYSLRHSPFRAALEGFLGFPSIHRTFLQPERMREWLEPKWQVTTGLGYLQSQIEPSRLAAVEREERCRDAIIVELQLSKEK